MEFYLTSAPDIVQAVILGVLILLVCIFVTYDCVMEGGSNRVIETARRTNALVDTLFPAEVKKRLLERSAEKTRKVPTIQSPKLMLQNMLGPAEEFLVDGSDANGGYSDQGDEPIADLFPDASVLFADIAGKI